MEYLRLKLYKWSLYWDCPNILSPGNSSSYHSRAKVWPHTWPAGGVWGRHFFFLEKKVGRSSVQFTTSSHMENGWTTKKRNWGGVGRAARNLHARTVCAQVNGPRHGVGQQGNHRYDGGRIAAPLPSQPSIDSGSHTRTAKHVKAARPRP